MNDIKPETVTLLQHLALTQALLNNHDLLAGTSYYRYEIKHKAKRLEEELSKKANKHLLDLFNADEEVMQEAVEACEKLTAIIASSNIEIMIFAKRIFDAVELGILTPEKVQNIIDNGETV